MLSAVNRFLGDLRRGTFITFRPLWSNAGELKMLVLGCGFHQSLKEAGCGLEFIFVCCTKEEAGKLGRFL